jgi:hypothetical protein
MKIRMMMIAILAMGVGAVTAASPDDDTAGMAFKQMAEVLRHPRCMNCHTVTQFPRQGDDRHRHQQLVLRGPADQGVAAMRCSNCHQAANSPDGRVPGAPHWQLAPLSMGWEHLGSDRELCEALKDTRKNGNRQPQALVAHMTADPLVQWAWAPGMRVPPPISQQEFHRLAIAWLQAGAACPRD